MYRYVSCWGPSASLFQHSYLSLWVIPDSYLPLCLVREYRPHQLLVKVSCPALRISCSPLLIGFGERSVHGADNKFARAHYAVSSSDVASVQIVCYRGRSAAVSAP